MLLFSELSTQKIRTCINQMMAVIGISCVIFLLIPTKQIPISEFTDRQVWQWLDALTGQHNLFPSLHVGLTLTIIICLFRYQSWWGRLLLILLFAILCLATLFTRKHFVADIAGGILVATSISFFSKILGVQCAKNSP
jgi:membrane-associated phospholipid phosphatase